MAFLLLSGCFPSSCRYTEPRALLPADSLSRAYAAGIPEDSLYEIGAFSGTDGHPLKHPRTLQFMTDGSLLVGDTERHSLFHIDPGGRFLGELPLPDGSFPYLAGGRGDTAFVFGAGTGRIYTVYADTVVREIELPTDPSALQFAVWHGDVVFLKQVSETGGAVLLSLDSHGRERHLTAPARPWWRHAGGLRMWGDTLVSLSGYRPVLDRFRPGMPPDTLALTGFDSPMLARSRAFMLGHVDEPPLLVASAAASGEELFVLNLRPGWLRVDVYGADGRLRRVLSPNSRSMHYRFLPQDIAVRSRPDGSVLVAVAASSPRPGVRIYRAE